MSFDDLPAETLVDIGSRLETSTLLSFGLVNRACRAAAVPSIYRSIVLYIRNPHTLASDVAKFDRAWTQADAFRHFRSLDIQGFPIPDGVDLNSTGGKKAYSMSWRIGHDAKRRAFPGTFPYLEGNIQEDDKFDWQPLADTLRKLRGLEHLTFDMAQQFPACLLEVLHSSLQKCKLEIRCFSLRSLRDEVVDPYGYELATSPNLISVHTCYTYLEEDGGYDVGDLNDLATLEMVSGLAPALKEVRLFHDVKALQEFRSSRDDLRLVNQGPISGPRRTWRGLSPKTNTRQGSLETLELSCDFDGEGIVTADCFARWAAATKFSALHKLHAHSVDEGAVQWLLTTPSFHNLTALRLGSISSEPSPFAHLSELLVSLPPLHELEIEGDFDAKHLDSLLSQQGDRGPLCKLRIASDSDAFDQIQITQLLRGCPNIETLTITVQRSLGDRTEYEMYRTIGRFTRLRSLALCLDCRSCDELEPGPYEPGDNENDHDEWRRAQILPNDPLFGAFEQEHILVGDDFQFQPLRSEHATKGLLNGAIDESLAVSIWDAISSAKPQGSVPLQDLQLYPRQDPVMEEFDDIREVLDVFQLQWILKSRGEIMDARPLVQSVPSEVDEVQVHESLVPILNKLWPGIMDGGKEWKTSWRSQPLWNPKDEAAL